MSLPRKERAIPLSCQRDNNIDKAINDLYELERLTAEDKACLNEWLNEVNQNKTAKHENYVNVVVEWLNDIANK